VFIALGDGIAPIKSLIEHAISIDQHRGLPPLLERRRARGHYHERWCRALKETLDNFAFTPLVGAGPADPGAMRRAPEAFGGALSMQNKVERGTSSVAPKYDKHPSAVVVGVAVDIGIGIDPDPDGRQVDRDFVCEIWAPLY
jgi:hypothetical protein